MDKLEKDIGKAYKLSIDDTKKVLSEALAALGMKDGDKISKSDVNKIQEQVIKIMRGYKKAAEQKVVAQEQQKANDAIKEEGQINMAKAMVQAVLFPSADKNNSASLVIQNLYKFHYRTDPKDYKLSLNYKLDEMPTMLKNANVSEQKWILIWGLVHQQIVPEAKKYNDMESRCKVLIDNYVANQMIKGDFLSEGHERKAFKTILSTCRLASATNVAATNVVTTANYLLNPYKILVTSVEHISHPWPQDKKQYFKDVEFKIPIGLHFCLLEQL